MPATNHGHHTSIVDYHFLQTIQTIEGVDLTLSRRLSYFLHHILIIRVSPLYNKLRQPDLIIGIILGGAQVDRITRQYRV